MCICSEGLPGLPELLLPSLKYSLSLFQPLQITGLAFLEFYFHLFHVLVSQLGAGGPFFDSFDLLIKQALLRLVYLGFIHCIIWAAASVVYPDLSFGKVSVIFFF